MIPALLACLAGTACAHLTYTGRDLGTFSPGNEVASSLKSGSISSTFGWAYSTDDDLGDSHRNRAFRFTLLTPGVVTLAVQSTGSGNPLLPAFSIYSGLSQLSPEQPGHDASVLSLTYLATLGGTQPKQGAFNALGDWSLGNDPTYNTANDPGSGILYDARLANFIYMGNAADGTSANYGGASGINGDGNADGYVTGSFNLAAGDYTLMVGGADYLVTPPAGPYTSYGVNVTLSVVPEPSAAVLTSLAGMILVMRRRRI